MKYMKNGHESKKLDNPLKGIKGLHVAKKLRGYQEGHKEQGGESH